jgi:glutamate synthase (NADPH/NADH)
MMLLDFNKHKVIDNTKLKKLYASRYLYAKWLQRQKMSPQEIVESVLEAEKFPPSITGALDVLTPKGL